MKSSRSHSQFVLDFSLQWLIMDCWSKGRKAYFLTMTFQENLTSLVAAKARWEPIADWFRRHGVRVIGAWQRQQRGAWHLHAVIDQFTAIDELRPFATARGWGSFLNLREIAPRRSDLQSPDAWRHAALGAVRYIARYVSRDACEEDADTTGHGLTLYVGGTRRGGVKFTWAGGLNKVWRLGCALWCQMNRSTSYDMMKKLHTEECRARSFGEVSMRLREEIMRLGLEEVFGDDRYTKTYARYWDRWGTKRGPLEAEMVPF